MVKVGDIVLDARKKEFEVIKIDDRGEFTYICIREMQRKKRELTFGKKAFFEKFIKKENK